jgi:enoyl-CoA hydratase/carnithine racemase
MLVTLECRGPVGVILLNDAGRRNALSTAIVEGVLDALAESRRSGAHAIVLASSQPAFCAGADIREMLESGWLEVGSREIGKTHARPPTPLDLFAALEAESRPVLAAVDGLALGGGVELLLSCDLILAGGNASFALPEIGLGVIPNTAIARLPELVGSRVALDLMLTRRRIDAAEALRIGLISQLVEGEPVLDRTVAVAAAIVEGAPPAAVAAVKRGVARGRSWAEIGALLGSMNRAEWEEGFSAFLARRKPDYSRFWGQA